MSEETTIQHKNRFFGTVILSELFKDRKMVTKWNQRNIPSRKEQSICLSLDCSLPEYRSIEGMLEETGAKQTDMVEGLDNI